MSLSRRLPPIRRRSRGGCPAPVDDHCRLQCRLSQPYARHRLAVPAGCPCRHWHGGPLYAAGVELGTECLYGRADKYPNPRPGWVYARSYVEPNTPNLCSSSHGWVIAAYTIQDGEAGEGSIVNSVWKTYSWPWDNPARIRVYVNSRLIGSEGSSAPTANRTASTARWERCTSATRFVWQSGLAPTATMPMERARSDQVRSQRGKPGQTDRIVRGGNEGRKRQDG